MSRDLSKESPVHRGESSRPWEQPEQRLCCGRVLGTLGEQLSGQSALRARGDEVQEAGRLAADYMEPCNYGKDCKAPEGQKQSHCRTWPRRSKSSVSQAYHHQSLDFHAVHNSSWQLPALTVGTLYANRFTHVISTHSHERPMRKALSLSFYK